ncbi:MAG: hypothetical protein EBZ48_04730 [Proteobacteria bacterium]|nr:hypothetical protein [Pseudomonadota bacterium]
MSNLLIQVSSANTSGSTPQKAGVAPSSVIVVGINTSLDVSLFEQPRGKSDLAVHRVAKRLDPLTTAERSRDPQIARWDTVANPLKATAVAVLSGALLVGASSAAAGGSSLLTAMQPFSFANAIATGVLLACAGISMSVAMRSMLTSFRELRDAWVVRRKDLDVSVTEGMECIKTALREASRDRMPQYGEILHRIELDPTNVVKGLTALYAIAVEQQTVRDRLPLLAVSQRLLTTAHRRCAVTQKICQAFQVSIEELASDKRHPIDLPLQVACVEGAMLASYGASSARDPLAAGILQIAARLTTEFSLPMMLTAHAVATQTSLERRSAEEMMLGKLRDVADARQKYSWLTSVAGLPHLESEQHRVIAAELQRIIPELPIKDQEIARLQVDRLLNPGTVVKFRLWRNLERSLSREYYLSR